MDCVEMPPHMLLFDVVASIMIIWAPTLETWPIYIWLVTDVAGGLLHWSRFTLQYVKLTSFLKTYSIYKCSFFYKPDAACNYVTHIYALLLGRLRQLYLLVDAGGTQKTLFLEIKEKAMIFWKRVLKQVDLRALHLQNQREPKVQPSFKAVTPNKKWPIGRQISWSISYKLFIRLIARFLFFQISKQ